MRRTFWCARLSYDDVISAISIRIPRFALCKQKWKDLACTFLGGNPWKPRKQGAASRNLKIKRNWTKKGDSATLFCQRFGE
jgi:hypothetical protein